MPSLQSGTVGDARLRSRLMLPLSKLPLPCLYLALVRSRHMTRTALSAAVNIPENQVAAHLQELIGLGWVQPSRDLREGVRAVHPTFALGLLVLDMLEGVRPSDSLGPMGGFRAAMQLISVYRAAFPATYLPSSLDSFSALVEDVLTQATEDVVSLHTAPVPDSMDFLASAMSYLHRRGVRYRAVMQEDHHRHEQWRGFRQVLREHSIPTYLHPSLPGRGVAIDSGLLAVYHDETGGIRIATHGAGLVGVEAAASRSDGGQGVIRPLVVLQHLCAGATTQAIATAVQASTRTIARDIAVLQRVFEVESRVALARRSSSIAMVSEPRPGAPSVGVALA